MTLNLHSKKEQQLSGFNLKPIFNPKPYQGIGLNE